MKTAFILIFALLSCSLGFAAEPKKKADSPEIPENPSDAGPWGTRRKYDERERIIWVRVQKEGDIPRVTERLRETEIYAKSSLVVIALEKTSGGGYWGTVLKDTREPRNQGKRMEKKEFHARATKLGGTWLWNKIEGVVMGAQISKKEDGNAF